MQISNARSADAPQLFAVWAGAIQSPHCFLGEAEIQHLAPLGGALLTSYAPIYCLRHASGAPFAMPGAANREMGQPFPILSMERA